MSFASGLAGTLLLTCAACATGQAPARQAPATTTAPASKPVPPRPSDADADVAYYRERTTALSSGALTDVARTDFKRMRRGRLYMGAGSGPVQGEDLDAALVKAFDSQNDGAILAVTAKMLAGNYADIQPQMLRAVVLRRAGRTAEANFHREVAIGLIESILRDGDGRGFDTAWTTFTVKEEWEVLKAGGYVVQRQSLVSHGDRTFDILEARKVDGGSTLRAHFDITEMFAEQARAFGLTK